jgi:hypothetical protein
VAATHIRVLGDANVARARRRIEARIPRDADDDGGNNKRPEGFVEAERRSVRRDVPVLLQGFRDGKATRAGVVRRVCTFPRVELGGERIEGDRVRFGECPRVPPVWVGHHRPRSRIAGTRAQVALIEGGTVPLVLRGDERGRETSRELLGPFVVLDVSAKPIRAGELLDLCSTFTHVPPSRSRHPRCRRRRRTHGRGRQWWQ